MGALAGLLVVVVAAAATGGVFIPGCSVLEACVVVMSPARKVVAVESLSLQLLSSQRVRCASRGGVCAEVALVLSERAPLDIRLLVVASLSLSLSLLVSLFLCLSLPAKFVVAHANAFFSLCFYYIVIALARLKEMARGGELFDLLLESGPPDEAHTAALMKALVGAVAFVQMHGIIHGDIKVQ